jgi:phage tail-like protein
MSTALTGHRSSARPTAFGALTGSIEGNLVQTVLVASEVVTIGRLPGCLMVLPHPTVSRQHAEVRVDRGRVLLADVGSSAGTFVDGQRLAPNQPVVVDANSDIRIGPYRLVYTPSAPAPAVEVESPGDYSGRSPSGPLVPSEEVEQLLASVPMRPTFPILPPPGPHSRYLRYLPAMFQDGDFLGRFLLIFEQLWEPLEQRQNQIHLYFDPQTSPAGFLPWLAGWLHLTLNPHWPEERRRRLLNEAMDLYRWRGTAYGLTRMIEVCTGLGVTLREATDQPYVFRIAVSNASGGGGQRALIEELITTHKPAHVGYVLEFTP